MSESIAELVDDLDESGVTVYVLQALDFVVPGAWENIVGFDNTIRHVTGEEDPAFIQAIAERANDLYNDPDEGYQRAMWLYRMADRTDTALATAAMVNKVSNRFSFLSFLGRLTPKPDTAQTIDLSLKLVIELLAFTKINGLPGDSITDFVRALADHSKESRMRMAALVCLDGLVPLGPDFTRSVGSALGGMGTRELENNSTYKLVQGDIPGDDSDSKLGFITKSFGAVTGWMDELIASQGLSTDKILSSISQYVDVSDDKLDYLGAFLDATTNYYTHTGTQTLARSLIERAVNEV